LDTYGDRFLAALADNGVTPHIQRVEAGTGIGQPLVTDDGEVSIIGIPRANAAVTPALVESVAEALDGVDYLIVQCEVPITASVRAAELAHARGARVLVNPAPAGPEAVALAERADVLILNLVEARMLGAAGDLQPDSAAAALVRQFDCPVVITLGAQGAVVASHDGTARVPAHVVESVDPTGAGDAFCAAFAVMLAEGSELDTALAFANAAGACAVGVAGAEPSMPRREAVTARLARS
jgi:ribokinase